MSKKIQITTGPVRVPAELNDSDTAQKIIEILPIHAKAQRWGDEIYFEIDIETELENQSTDIVSEGQLAFWQQGNAFCIFFGQTPASRNDEIRAASAVNIIGKIIGDLSHLRQVEDGADVLIESA